MYPRLVTQTIAWTEHALNTSINIFSLFPSLTNENEGQLVKHILCVGPSSWAQTLQQLPLGHRSPHHWHLDM